MKHPLLVAISLAPLACASAEAVTITPATPVAPAAEVTVAAAPAPAPKPTAEPQAPAPKPVESPAPAPPSPTDDAPEFGMIGLLAPADPSAQGNMWGATVGDSNGAGGLGLGGGGRGEGIGLGSIGTLGHGTGTGYGFGRGAHRTKPPQIRMGAVSVSGRLPPEVIQRIVRQSFGRFRLCYETGLRKNPKLQGQVSVKFTIAPNGAVAGVQNAGSDLPDSAVIGCVTKSFTSLSFPQPEGGKVVVVYPMKFSPGEEAAKPAPPPAPATPAPTKPEPPPSQSGTKASTTGSARD